MPPYDLVHRNYGGECALDAPANLMRSDFENILEEFYTALLVPGDVCVDVGAHLGRHALPIARRVGPAGEVHAFEPIPDCVATLRTAFAALRGGAKMVLYPTALGDFTGLSEFVLVKNLPEYSGLKERVYDQPVETQKIQVEVHKLDEYGVHLPRLRYIKVDAEGGEYGILKGASATLAKFKPVVTFEFGMNSSGKYGIVPSDLFDHLAGFGYRIADIRGKALERAAFDESARVQHVWDYVAVQPVEFELVRRCLIEIGARPGR